MGVPQDVVRHAAENPAAQTAVAVRGQGYEAHTPLFCQAHDGIARRSIYYISLDVESLGPQAL